MATIESITPSIERKKLLEILHKVEDIHNILVEIPNHKLGMTYTELIDSARDGAKDLEVVLIEDIYGTQED